MQAIHLLSHPSNQNCQVKPPVKSLLLTILSSQRIKSKFHILRGSKMFKAHVLLQAAACFWTPPFMPSPLYFNTNLQVSIFTHLSATETGTKSSRNLKAENHNWTVSEKVERQISFSCYLGCITTCFFKYKSRHVCHLYFLKQPIRSWSCIFMILTL